MDLDLIRTWLTPKSTIGVLKRTALPVTLAFTLEDYRREIGEPKVPKETAIPEGRYELIRTKSTRFGVWMPLLFNVRTKEGRLLVQQNGMTFEGVRLHWGNTAVDTEGCVLVGKSREGDRILDSRAAFAWLDAQLAQWLVNDRIWVNVKLAPATERLVC